VGSAKASYVYKSDVLAIQGHPRSLILVPIESAYATSYRGRDRLRDIAGSVLQNPPLFHHIFGGVPVGPDRRCWGSI